MPYHLRKYIQFIPSLVALILLLYAVVQIFIERWSEYRSNPNIAVSDAISESKLDYRKYLARKYINSNVKYVVTSSFRSWPPIINNLVYEYDSKNNDKQEILRLIHLLVNNNANVNSTWDGITALHQAISINQVGVVKELLKLGADPTRVGENEVSYCPSSTSLEFAMCLHSINDRSEVIAVLLENGAGG